MQQGPNERLRAAVVGYGAYGRFHASKYRDHPNAELVAVAECDSSARRRARFDLPHVDVFSDADALAGRADIASVTVPASQHHVVARELLRRGLHLLVEKPFTTSLAQANELIRLANERSLTLQPGYLERFNLTLGELHELFPEPGYVEARRLTNWRGRGADVSVVLDLMIHDIDMLLEIVDAPLVDLRAHGVKVVTGQWDVVNAQLRFANGCIANLTASRASPLAERRLHVFSRDACALADVDAGEILLHQRSEAQPAVMTERRICRHEDPLGAEIDAFIKAVRNECVPPVDTRHASRALAIAERIHAAMEPDEELLARTAAPLTDSRQAIAYLMMDRADRPRDLH